MLGQAVRYYMAPKSKAVAAPQEDAPQEIIEEIQPELPTGGGAGPSVTFVLDDEALDSQYDEEYDEEDDVIDDDEEDALITAVGQLTQLLMTEEGEAITDVLNGIRDALEKQNKIQYRALQLLEGRFGKK